MSDPTVPIDYAFTARVKKASDLANVLMNTGWTPGTTINDPTWILAVKATGRKPRRGKREVDQPSDETKTLTIQLLEERWKERTGRNG